MADVSRRPLCRLQLPGHHPRHRRGTACGPPSARCRASRRSSRSSSTAPAARTSTVRKLPGLKKFTNLTLKRGITGDTAFWHWIRAAMDGQVQRVDGVIELLDETRTPGPALALPPRLAVQVRRTQPARRRAARWRWRPSRSPTRAWSWSEHGQAPTRNATPPAQPPGPGDPEVLLDVEHDRGCLFLVLANVGPATAFDVRVTFAQAAARRRRQRRRHARWRSSASCPCCAPGKEIRDLPRRRARPARPARQPSRCAPRSPTARARASASARSSPTTCGCGGIWPEVRFGGKDA